MKSKILILLISFLLTSCVGQKTDVVEQAKIDLGVNSGSVSVEDDKEDNEKNEEESSSSQKQEIFSVNYLTDNKFIDLDSLDPNDLQDGEVEITGNTLVNVDEISVSFSNSGSDYPDDEYKLNLFKSGDKTFLYRAFSRFETLDYGTNVYVFTAKSGELESKLELTIEFYEDTLEKLEDNKEDSTVQDSNESEEIEDNQPKDGLIDISSLPESEEFGSPSMVGEIVTYSDLKGLELWKQDTGNVNCDSLNEFLSDDRDGYFWWNTCRDIEKEKGISFYLIRLEEDKYFYEKHYIVLDKSIYASFELDSGNHNSETGQEKLDFLKSKNDELKEKNQDYTVLAVVDKLFREIVKN